MNESAEKLFEIVSQALTEMEGLASFLEDQGYDVEAGDIRGFVELKGAQARIILRDVRAEA